MLRDIVKINEDLCTGCGLCIPNCQEGALQIVEGKARLVSDLMCDGLGACIGHCPEGAISIEQREAEAYNETQVMKEMIEKGKATVIAHLKHLKDHGEKGFVKEGIAVLKAQETNLDFSVDEVMQALHQEEAAGKSFSACPGTQAQAFKAAGSAFAAPVSTAAARPASQLEQWPVQMHLINPMASFFKKSDFLLAADCAAFSMGAFHQDLLKGKTLGIACPKLDTGKDSYLEKLIQLVDEAEINTLTVVIMEVPCCGGLLHLAQQALSRAERHIPIKKILVSIKGEMLSEEWV